MIYKSKQLGIELITPFSNFCFQEFSCCKKGSFVKIEKKIIFNPFFNLKKSNFIKTNLNLREIKENKQYSKPKVKSMPNHSISKDSIKSKSLNDSSMISIPIQTFSGTANIPGDKSISIRFLILAAIAEGKSEAMGMLESEDSLNTAYALQKMGIRIEKHFIEQAEKRHPPILLDKIPLHKNNSDMAIWKIEGCGRKGFKKPKFPLDLGNSGTGCRLLMGALSFQGFDSKITGDKSLQQRPMARILTPLSQLGCVSISQPNGTLPIKLFGNPNLHSIQYRLPIPSAQLKSALLIAGIKLKGKIEIEELISSRKHTENLLPFFGVQLDITQFNLLQSYSENHLKKDSFKKRKQDFPKKTGHSSPLSGTRITLKGPQQLKACQVSIPSDPSSAAFPIITALLIKNASITVSKILDAPERTGYIQILRRMNAKLEIIKTPDEQTHYPFVERTMSINAFSSHLKSVHIYQDEVPSLIDELPILSVAAAFAEGMSQFDGLAELRFKESDRLQAILTLLTQSGIKAYLQKDSLFIKGCFPEKPFGKAHCITQYDHRLAMSALIMGAAAQHPVSIDNAHCISTSFPNFLDIMQTMGAHFKPNI